MDSSYFIIIILVMFLSSALYFFFKNKGDETVVYYEDEINFLKEKNSLIILFTGDQYEVIHLKGMLEENEIPSIIQNDFQSGAIAGFSGGIPSAIDLYIRERDLEKGKEILEDFKQFQNKDVSFSNIE